MARVGLFVPCFVDVIRPGDREHATRVLEALGDEVEPIAGRCCGQPAFNSGFRDEARQVTLEALRAAREFETVVTLSGSCTSMMHHYAPRLFEGTKADGAERIGGRFVEFAAYVSDHPHLPAVGLRLSEAVAYHDSCHNRRELGATETVVGLLESIEGLDLRRLRYEEECCGFGGTFSVKLPEIAGAMAGSKAQDAASSEAPMLVSTDASCLAHLERAGCEGLPTTVSIAELLSKALP